MAKITLFENQDGAINGPARDVSFSGEFVCQTCGTFDGAIIKLQQLGPDGQSWIDVAGSSLQEPGSFLVTLAEGEARGVIEGGNANGLYMTLNKV